MEVNIEDQFRKFSTEVGGEYFGVNLIEGRAYPEVKATISDWDIHLKIQVIVAANGAVVRPQTVMKSPYRGAEPFKFQVRGGYWNNAGDKFVDWLTGAKDVTVGEKDFDKAFLIHSKDDDRIKLVLNEPVQSKLIDLEDAWLEMSHDGEGFELAYFDIGITVAVDRLVKIAQLLVAVQNQLKATTPVRA